MQRTKVGVLRGGPSREYDVSLKTGNAVLSNLDQEKYQPLDVLISRDGEWHMRGKVVEPSQVLDGVDVVFNAMHGEYGEDGKVQKLLDAHSIPYTGSRALPSSVCMNKGLTKRSLNVSGIKMAHDVVVENTPLVDQKLFELFRSFPQPSVIKPLIGGSSVGVTIARSFEEFINGVHHAFTFCPKALIEECIQGREATCAILEQFRDSKIYIAPPVEIIPPPTHSFFDYDAKYGGESEEICPGNFDQKTRDELTRIARDIHEALGIRHYSRSDFIVSPRGIYFLEVNTLPGLTEESLVPKALQAVGCSFPEFLDHLISLAAEGN